MPRSIILPLVLVAFPAVAAPVHYHAEPTSPPARQRFVARDNVWRCSTDGCTSSRTAARPAIVCATLVREVGTLRSFTVAGRPFAAEEIEACNRRAR